MPDLNHLHISKSSWLFRYYLWSLEIWLKFTHRKDELSLYSEKDNLCHLVRAMLGAPVAFLCHLIVFAYAIIGVFVIPIRLFGIKTYLQTIGIIFGLVLGIAGVVWIYVKLIERCEERNESTGKISGFRQLLNAYSESKLHSKICPQIDFVEGEEKQ